MKKRTLNLLIFLCLWSIGTKASHIFGGDLLYTHISGNTYQVKLSLYGDCAGSAFSLLAAATPQVTVYNNTVQYSTINLSSTGPGVNVTPVCPQFANNTQCSNPSSTIPGVTRYIFVGNITLPSSSANWRFRFEGQLTNHLAGRSNSITNINIGTNGSLMSLEAKLNNLDFPNNNSPQYTTVPTPFFCINQPSSFNPGAVDPDADSLSFGLVNALEPAGTVNYSTGYSATSPVSATASGFNASNGQFNFTPNIVQISVVANEVSEYRNGILVGSSMREMNFVVQNNCNNSAPSGGITSPNGGVVVNPTFFRTCPAPNTISFQVSPVDSNGDTINVTYSGIPAGASASVTNNNTTNPTFNFSWNLLSATPGNSYTIFLTFTDYGCPLSAKQTIAYTIYVLPKPDFHLTIIDSPTCVSKAVFELTPFLNQAPYDIDISQGTTIVKSYSNVSSTLTDSLDPGTYTVTMTDNYNCTLDTNITLDPPPPLHAAISNMNSPICFGDSTGSFTVTAISGKAPFTYALNGGTPQSSGAFSGLPGGSHIVTIRDANFCEKDTTIVLNNPNDIMLNTTFQKPPCNSFQNGAITVSAYNTAAPYTYSFNGGAFGTTTTFTGLYSGTYPVIVKDGLGCEKLFDVILPDSIKISATLLIDDILCYGDSLSSITVNATSGFPPYMYQLDANPLQTSNVFTNLGAGTYQILVTDTESCVWDTTITLTQPDSMTLSTTVIDPLCSYSADGEIIVSVVGGVSPINYSLNGGASQTSSTFTGLSNGTYTITVTDDNGCTKDIIATLASPSEIFGVLTIDSTTCAGTADGSIGVVGSGGIPPYSYSIGGPFQVSGSFTGLASGTYIVSIRDSNLCIKDTIVEVLDPVIVPSVLIDTPICVGDSNGTITVTATGAQPGYTYSLSSAGPYVPSGVFTNIAAGTYTIYVKDANNCTHDTTIVVSDPPEIMTNVSFKKPPCNAFQNGEITVVAHNSVGPYTYSLDGGPFQPTGVFTGLYSGPYIVTVKNALGCEKDFNVILPDSIKIEAQVNLTHNPCFGDALGSIEINASSGFPPYVYSIDGAPHQISNMFSNLPAATYAIQVKDTNDCYWDSTVVITQPDSIQIADSTVRLSCYQSGDGEVYFTVTGGTSPYTYAIDGGAYQASNGFTGLIGGWHTVSILDSNNCTNMDSFFVFEPDSLYLTYVPTNPTCFGVSNGEITATGVGGTTPYSYTINGGTPQTSGTFTGLALGTYLIGVIDSYGCTFDTTVTLTQPDSLSLYTDIQNPLCATLANGTVTIHGSGGTSPYSYSVDGGAFGVDSVLNPIAAGTHIFTLRDSNLCTKDTIITLVDSFVLSANIFTSNATCNNTGTGFIAIEGTGGNAPYLYGINGSGYTNTDTFINLFAGTHTVSSKDQYGCIFDTTIALVQPTPVAITASVTAALCYDSSSASITALGSNGTAPYTYSIDGINFQVLGTFDNLAANTYTITVMDDNGCTHDTIIHITQPAPIQMLIENEPALCHGTSSALVTVTASQGTAPYMYSIDGGALQSTNVFSTAAGTHTLLTMDVNGCAIDSTILVTEPSPVQIDLEIINPSCTSDEDGEVRVIGSGGVSNYTYSMNGSTPDPYGLFQNLPGGNYVFSVQDSNGCSKDTTISLIPKYNVTINNISIQGETCYDFKDGVISVDASAFPPIRYHLRNYVEDNLTGTFAPVESGWYTVTVEDSTGCTLDTNVYVPIPDPFSINIESLLNDCDMSNNEAYIEVTGEGGISPYSFVWSTGATSTTISNLSNGLYTVYAEDMNGCRDTAEAEITFDNCCNPFIPNAFSPNNDGQNDYFSFYYNGDVKLLSFQIYSRWGKLLFETNDPSRSWDGRYDGKDVDVGVYFYKIRFICGHVGDDLQELSGDLTLIR